MAKIARKVFVGMSGGVDSSVSACLLKKAGFNVTGVFIKVWQPDWIECNWKEERLEAMRAAAHIGIPFVTLDLEKEYKKEVIDYMIAEYEAGRTPNPDVMCNRYVKFGAFWKWAKEKGADYVATGHYAINKTEENGTFRLLAGRDTNKDQSYFLWTLNQKDLEHIMFPVGDMEKSEVRKLAKKFKLPNAEKKDSQGLCFIGKVDVKKFLSHYIKSQKGDVLDENGKVIGSHTGSIFFTIGERHGFSINDEIKGSNDKPYYVISKDSIKNTLTVSTRENHISDSKKKKVSIKNVNWVNSSPMINRADFLNSNFGLSARMRYRQSLQKIRIVSVNETEAVIEFEKMQDTITPGQSLVIYDGAECLGGGIIE